MAGPLPSFSLLEDEVERKPKISDSDGEDIDFPPGEEDGDEDELVQEEDDDDEMEDGIVGAGTGLFNIQNRIKRAKHGSMSIRDLYQMICDKRINLNPPYQREAVWTQPRQVGLVDSIFVGAAIPALVFSVTTGNDGQERRNVIDGKQRLTTISRFMAGEFPYRNKKNTRNKSYYWKMKPGVSNKATSFRVPPEEKTWFEETHIPCIDFHDIAIEQEEDIFTRIQQGMVLAGGEKTSVGTTPRKEFIKDLVKTFFRSPTSPVPHLIDIDISRKRDFTDLTAFVYCCEGLPQDRVKPTLEAQRNWLERKDDLSKGFRKQITDAMDDFWRIVEHHNHPFITVAQRVAPVEFCFIGVYFFVTHGQGIEDDVLADEVLQMRKRCHSEFPGVVKMNSTLFQWWWKELDDIAARPENGHQRLPYLIDPIGTAPAKTTTRQRKVKPRRNEVATRAVEDEDREDEMDVDTVPTQQVENPRRTPQRGSPSTSGPSIQKRPRTVSNGLDSEAGSPSKVGPPAHWGPLKSAKGSTSYASPLKKARLTGDQFVAYKVRSRSQSPGV